MPSTNSLIIASKRLFTLNDNKTPDLYPIVFCGLVVAFIGYTGWSLLSGHTFNPMDYGLGGSSLLAGHGAAKRFDRDATEVEDLSGREKP